MILHRCFPWDERADAAAPGGALWFPRVLQGEGRHDAPGYSCLYVSEEPVAAVVEQLAPLTGTELGAADLLRAGRPLSLATLALADAARLVDLDEPLVLAAEGLRPSLVATEERPRTQASASALYERHANVVGLRWWSRFESQWANVTLFDRALEALAVEEDPAARAGGRGRGGGRSLSRPQDGRVTVEELLARRFPSRVADAVMLMEALERALPPGDGVAWFLRLYRPVTEGVEARAIAGGAFGDPRCLRWLDVVFANLFFRALRDWSQAPTVVPKAWAPLFEARDRPEIAPIQFALAGMNAHINRDLPFALVETWAALGLEPDRGAVQYRDFTLVNELLEEVEARVKAEFATGALGHVERSLGEVDDAVAIWKVSRAREAAWANAETLWALRAAPAVRSEFAAALDRLVGFAGRGLLRPL